METLRTSPIRDIRPEVVNEIASRIESTGYNSARSLIVQPADDTSDYNVIDGNHRLLAIQKVSDIDSSQMIPCIVLDEETDPYEVAVQTNREEDAYASLDLFDYLDIIEDLKNAGQSLAAISKKLDWGESKVKKYSRILSNVVPSAREYARSAQRGAGTEKVPVGTVEFSERWFRDSGIYQLQREDEITTFQRPDEDVPPHAQLRLLRWFVETKQADASKRAVKNHANTLNDILDQLAYLDDKLQSGVENDVRDELREGVIKGEYTAETIRSAVQNANEGAKNRMLFGVDALDRLENVESNSVDVVFIDPPYGTDYESHRETERPDFGVSLDDVTELLADVIEEVSRVAKDNAHVYLFFSMNAYEEILAIAEEYLEVYPTPLIWKKSRHVPTQNKVKGSDFVFAPQYEPFFFCRMENGKQRTLNGFNTNVFEYTRPTSDDRWHDSQKPRALYEELIEISSGKQETVIDPMAGSGAALLAAAETDRHFIGFEKSEVYESGFRRELNKIE